MSQELLNDLDKEIGDEMRRKTLSSKKSESAADSGDDSDEQMHRKKAYKRA